MKVNATSVKKWIRKRAWSLSLVSVSITLTTLSAILAVAATNPRALSPRSPITNETARTSLTLLDDGDNTAANASYFNDFYFRLIRVRFKIGDTIYGDNPQLYVLMDGDYGNQKFGDYTRGSDSSFFYEGEPVDFVAEITSKDLNQNNFDVDISVNGLNRNVDVEILSISSQVSYTRYKVGVWRDLTPTTNLTISNTLLPASHTVAGINSLMELEYDFVSDANPSSRESASFLNFGSTLCSGTTLPVNGVLDLTQDFICTPPVNLIQTGKYIYTGVNTVSGGDIRITFDSSTKVGDDWFATGVIIEKIEYRKPTYRLSDISDIRLRNLNISRNVEDDTVSGQDQVEFRIAIPQQ